MPLRTASFSLEDRRLLWARVRLYTNRLTLSGWGFWERYWRTVPMQDIEQVEHKGTLLIIRLTDETVISLRLDNAGRWVSAIRTHRAVYEQEE